MLMEEAILALQILTTNSRSDFQKAITMLRLSVVVLTMAFAWLAAS
jgi:hypothetical protein